MPLPVRIADRMVGPGQPCFVVAEAGVNHNGDPAVARRLVDAAAAAGADAVKFQTFRAEAVASVEAPKAAYAKATTGKEESHLDMLRRLELSASAHRDIHGYCRSRGIIFMSTPFDVESVGLLEDLDVPVFKIPSGEINNPFLLRRVGRTCKPAVLSTGMAYLGEVEFAVRTLREAGCADVVLLHCTSNYPADPADANLRALATLASAFDLPVGFSDHTEGTECALAAVALGACLVEKHITLDRGMDGPDHRSSAEPEAFTRMVKRIRTVESALGSGRKVPAVSEADTRTVARRSLALIRDVGAGEALEEGVLTALRPATGIPPQDLDAVVGRRLARDMRAGALLGWQDLA